MWPCIVTNFLIIKPIRCINFSNLFWKWNSTCFGQFLCPSSGVIHCTLSDGMSYRFVDSFRVGSWSCCSKAVYKPVWNIPLLRVQWITPGDGQRNCPKYVEFHFQNKFEKLEHLVGFIIRKLSLEFVCCLEEQDIWHLKGYLTCESSLDSHTVQRTAFP
jgi:hypothetical protein